MKSFNFGVPLVLALNLVACSNALENFPGVYKIDIQQGNIVNQTMVDQIRPSMTERQVLYILGSPMLTDTFGQKRWDYLYSNQPSGEDRQQKKISILFNEANEVAGIQGDFKPSETEVEKPSEETTVDVPKREIEKTMWQKITGLFGLDDTDDVPEPDYKRARAGSQLKTGL